MINRLGSIATSALLGVAALGMIGTAGYMAVTGNTVCSMIGGSCYDNADTDATASTVLASTGSNETAKSCCPLGALAKGACSGGESANVEVIAASTEAKSNCAPDCTAACSGNVVSASTAADCGANCSDKSSCGDKAAAVNVVAASTTAKSCCGGGSCGDKAAATVMAASTTSDCGSACSDKAACGDKAAATVMAASTASDCGSACSDKAACGDAVACSNNVFNTRMTTILAAFNTAAEKMACGSSCSSSCGDKAADVVAASTTSSCCGGNAVMASAKAGCCPALASQGVAHMASSTTPVFVPAAFFSTASIDMNNLTKAECCRSAAENCSGESTCGDTDKACCSEGTKTVAAN